MGKESSQVASDNKRIKVGPLKKNLLEYFTQEKPHLLKAFKNEMSVAGTDESFDKSRSANYYDLFQKEDIEIEYKTRE
jgi:hypothetical protein